MYCPAFRGNIMMANEAIKLNIAVIFQIQHIIQDL